MIILHGSENIKASNWTPFYKVIKVETCKQCPFSKPIHNNKHIACNHTKIQVKFPYERDREVITDTIPGYCPL